MKNKPSRQVQRAQHAATLSTPQRQRGAAAVFAGAAIAALVMSMFLAINIGTLYFAQRDLQRQAVMAAIAGAGVGSGCRNGGVPGSLAAVTQQVTNSLANNAAGNKGTAILLTGVNGAPAVQLGWVNNFSGQSVTDDSNNKQSVPADGLTHFLPLTKTEGDSHMNAVRVNLSEVLASPFSNPLFPVAPMNLKASATARQQALGSFYLGTTLLSLQTQGSPLLNPLLQALLCGGAPTSACQAKVGLVAGSYTGLANANISLGDLLGAATAANVGITDLASLLSTNLTLPQWLGILGSTLSNTVDGTTGQVSNGVAGLVQGLAGVAYTGGNSFNLGSILNTAGLDLNPAVSGIVGAVPFVDGLDLLQALGQAAIAPPSGVVVPITLPITVNVPALVAVNAYLSVGAPAKFAVGPAASVAAKASTAEITLMIRISGGALLSTVQNLLNGVVNGVLSLLGLLDVHVSLTVLPPPLNIGVDVNVAAANASLNQLQCPSSGSATPIASLGGQTAVTTVNVGPFTGTSTTIPTPLSSSNTYNWTIAEVKVTGILGSTDTSINLDLTSLGVGVTPFTLANVTQFITPPTGNPLTYIAYGAPSYPPATNNDNPQTVGSNIGVSLNLGLQTVNAPGSTGLVGALTGLITTLFNVVVSVLNGLIGLVNGLLTALINPLLSLLGIQAGSATVIMDSVTVAPPVVVTTILPGLPGS